MQSPVAATVMGDAAAPSRGRPSREYAATLPAPARKCRRSIEVMRRVYSAEVDPLRVLSRSLQESSAFEYRRHRLLDPCHPCRRLLGGGKVVQITSLSPWC